MDSKIKPYGEEESSLLGRISSGRTLELNQLKFQNWNCKVADVAVGAGVGVLIYIPGVTAKDIVRGDK